MKFVELTDRDHFNQSVFIDPSEVIAIERANRNYKGGKDATVIYFRNGATLDVADSEKSVAEKIEKSLGEES